MTTPLDDLMQADPLSLTREDIDGLIAHYRRQREGGPKPRKEQGVEKKIDLKEIGLITAKPSNFVRRI